MGVVGLIPAAGLAKRLGILPFSKELFPVGLAEIRLDDQPVQYPKPIITYLLERMALAQASKLIVIISREKGDILRFLGSGEKFGDFHISYLVQEIRSGMPYALDLAYDWIRNDTIVFGMPDTIFFPEDAMAQLMDFHQTSNADLTLGLFPTEKPQKFGMVSFDQQTSQVGYIVDKPAQTGLKYMWGIACWNPTFTHLLHVYLQQNTAEREVVLGDIFQAAVDGGLKVLVKPFDNGKYVDIGTTEDLAEVVKRY